MNARTLAFSTLCLAASTFSFAAMAEPRDGRAFDVGSGVQACMQALRPTGTDDEALRRAGWNRIETRNSGAITETNWTRGGRSTRMIVLVGAERPLCGFTLRGSSETEFRLIEAMIATQHGAADLAPNGGKSRIWKKASHAIMLAEAREGTEFVTKVLVSQL